MIASNSIPFEPMQGSSHHHYDQVAKAIDYLYEHFREQPSLEEVAARVNMSAYHFQRIFTGWAGISPKRFLQYLTTDYLKQRITGFDNLIDAADDAGLSGQSRVYDLFVTLEAVTPQEFREKGKGIAITYGFHNTPFGECLIGITERGVCHLSFLSAEGREQAVAEMQKAWEYAAFHHNEQLTEPTAALIFRQAGEPRQQLNILVKGTNFQVKVWNALLQVPMGNITTYQSIAKTIGYPRALQAVGSAVGANPVAYLIPCHRVIRKNLIIGEYHWGSERKKAMLGWEMMKTA